MTPSGISHRILVVDDDPLIRTGLQAILGKMGYEVAAVGDGAAAIEVIDANPPDLILLDLKMPGMDGFGVLDRLNSSIGGLRIPVIVVSEAREGKDTERIVRSLEMGAVDFISKPFEPAVLRARIGGTLERRRLHNREIEAAEERMGAMTDMAGRVGHDFNNIILVILNKALEIKQSLADPGPISEMADGIQSVAEQAT